MTYGSLNIVMPAQTTSRFRNAPLRHPGMRRDDAVGRSMRQQFVPLVFYERSEPMTFGPLNAVIPAHAGTPGFQRLSHCESWVSA